MKKSKEFEAWLAGYVAALGTDEVELHYDSEKGVMVRPVTSTEPDCNDEGREWSNWIGWKGMGFPKHLQGCTVELKYRNGKTLETRYPESFSWRHFPGTIHPPEYDIVAYRVVTS